MLFRERAQTWMISIAYTPAITSTFRYDGGTFLPYVSVHLQP